MDLHEWNEIYGSTARDDGWCLVRNGRDILLLSTGVDGNDEAAWRRVAEAAGAGDRHAYHACEVLRDDFRRAGTGDWPAVGASLRTHLRQVEAELERRELRLDMMAEWEDPSETEEPDQPNFSARMQSLPQPEPQGGESTSSEPLEAATEDSSPPSRVIGGGRISWRPETANSSSENSNADPTRSSPINSDGSTSYVPVGSTRLFVGSPTRWMISFSGLSDREEGGSDD